MKGVAMRRRVMERLHLAADLHTRSADLQTAARVNGRFAHRRRQQDVPMNRDSFTRNDSTGCSSMKPRRLLLRDRQSPGDVVMLTAAVAELGAETR